MGRMVGSSGIKHPTTSQEDRPTDLCEAVASLVPQNNHGIDIRCSPGQAYARSEARQEQDQCDGGKRKWIGRRYTPDQRRQPARRRESTNSSGDDACKYEPQRFAKHEVEDISAPRAQRHANSERLHLPRNRIVHHAIDSDNAQHETKPGEDAEEEDAEARFRQPLIVQKLLDRLNLHHRLIRIDRVNLLLNRIREVLRRAMGGHQKYGMEECFHISGGGERHIDFRVGSRIRRPAASPLGK